MAYKGKYQPSHPRKYKGDPTNITFRSLWERKFMNWCDQNANVLEWSSEEIIIPYRGPDGKPHRYFPDFYMKVKQSNGTNTDGSDDEGTKWYKDIGDAKISVVDAHNDSLWPRFKLAACYQ